jgi:hypothetical protein
VPGEFTAEAVNAQLKNATNMRLTIENDMSNTTIGTGMRLKAMPNISKKAES